MYSSIDENNGLCTAYLAISAGDGDGFDFPIFMGMSNDFHGY